MAKQVIHIFGASGSGTSTLGKKIYQELGYQFMDTDDYLWVPTNPKFTTLRTIEERLTLMKADIEKADNVVISGSLVGWGDELISYFTLAIFLITPTNIRVERLKRREKERFGKRIEKGGDMYQTHQDFITWAKAYDDGDINIRSKALHKKWMQTLPCNVIQLNGADDLDENFKLVKELL